jgi:hypothetical protein
MRRPLKRYELIELIITANFGATRQNFPDIPQLRDDTTQDIIVRAMESFSVDVMPNSPQGNAVATMAQLQNAFLTLYIEGEESVRQIFLPRLCNTAQALSTGLMKWQNYPTDTEDLKVDWNKSYIQFAQPPNTGGANAQFSIMLGVEYKKLPPGTYAAMTKNKIPGT